MPTYVLTLTCPDRPGIIHAVAGALLELGANVLEQAQFTDVDTGLFAMRTRFEAPEREPGDFAQAVIARAPDPATRAVVRDEARVKRAMLMVSRQDHCLVDLLYRHRIGELPVALPLVVSNHEDCRALVESHGVPFVWLPVTPVTREQQEAELLRLADEHRIDVIVLARYMQVLSPDLCARMPGRIINIHHSFLPGFTGARPYHQAHDRGVKLIGATAHFVTAELDEGPIIEQDVERVDHSYSPALLAEIGRDIERVVLARAVRLYAEDRIILNGNRTIVFS